MSFSLCVYLWLLSSYSEYWAWNTWMNLKIHCSSPQSYLTRPCTTQSFSLMRICPKKHLKSKLTLAKSWRRAIKTRQEKDMLYWDRRNFASTLSTFQKTQWKFARHSSVTKPTESCQKHQRHKNWTWWAILTWWTICLNRICSRLSTWWLSK